MGRGIIHEPDDIREDNPPSNPELLAYLEKELVSSSYDLKHLKRLIFTSTVYQFSSIARSKETEAAANFASYLLRRVEAEVLIDAVNEITGSSDLYTSAVPEPFTYIPNSMSAVALAALGPWFLLATAQLGGFDQASVRAFIAEPWNSVLLILLGLTLSYHSKLGLQVVIEDYVHGPFLKVVSLVANKFFHVVVAAAATVAVLRIAFGSGG